MTTRLMESSPSAVDGGESQKDRSAYLKVIADAAIEGTPIKSVHHNAHTWRDQFPQTD